MTDFLRWLATRWCPGHAVFHGPCQGTHTVNWLSDQWVTENPEGDSG